jgi:hypothetical protein
MGTAMSNAMQDSSTEPLTEPRTLARVRRRREYRLAFHVTASSQWELLTWNIPEGVEIRDVRGEWRDGKSGVVLLARGDHACSEQLKLRVRAAAYAPTDWMQRLDCRVRPVFRPGLLRPY